MKIPIKKMIAPINISFSYFKSASTLMDPKLASMMVYLSVYDQKPNKVNQGEKKKNSVIVYKQPNEIHYGNN